MQNEGYPERVAADLRDARSRAGLSQEEMVSRLRALLPYRAVTPPALSDWERGIKMPGADVYVASLDVADKASSLLARRARALEERASLILDGVKVGKLKASELASKLVFAYERPPGKLLSVDEAKEVLGLKYRGSVYHRIVQGRLPAYWWERKIQIPEGAVQKLVRSGARRTRGRQSRTSGSGP